MNDNGISQVAPTVAADIPDRTMYWTDIPRRNGTERWLFLRRRQHKAGDRLLCKVIPHITPTTHREFFTVETPQSQQALIEHGANFDKLADAIAWCEATSWSAEVPENAPAELDEAIPARSKQMPKRLTQTRSEQPLDEIEKPAHYNVGKIEVIDALEDWKLGPHEFTAVAYIARAKHKGTELKDLKKARWYLNRRIKQLEDAELCCERSSRYAATQSETPRDERKLQRTSIL